MSDLYFLKQAEKFEIQAYQRPADFKSFKITHVPFTGSPRRHPMDPKRVILISDPYSTQTFYYEFSIQDITYAEELPNIVNMEGEVLPVSRVWVKKGAVAIRSTPFIVEDTRL